MTQGVLSPLAVDLALSELAFAASGVPSLASRSVGAAALLRGFLEESFSFHRVGSSSIPPEAQIGLNATLQRIEPIMPLSVADSSVIATLRTLIDEVEKSGGVLSDDRAEALADVLASLERAKAPSF